MEVEKKWGQRSDGDREVIRQVIERDDRARNVGDQEGMETGNDGDREVLEMEVLEIEVMETER